jgi:hypothetical protein
VEKLYEARTGWTCSANGETRNACSIFARNLVEKTLLDDKRIWEYIPIIKVDQGELDYEFGKYVELAQVRMKRRVLMLSVLNFIFAR